jgi:hypothetical protein
MVASLARQGVHRVGQAGPRACDAAGVGLARAALTLGLIWCAVAACKRGSRGAPPGEDAAATVDDLADGDGGAALDADEVELLAAVDDGALEVALERRADPAVVGDVIHVHRTHVSFALVVEATGDAPVRARLPTALFAHLPGYAYPYEGEGCLPPRQFLVTLSGDAVEVAAGTPLRVPVEAAWYLGNAHRPPPAAASGPTRFTVEAAPDDDPLVRLADEVADAPELGGLAFAIAGGCSPEPWLTEAAVGGVPIARLARIEQALAAAGVEARSPAFDEARARKAEILARLETELETYRARGSIEGLAVLYAASDPAFRRAYAGDPDVSAAVARYLEPDASGAPPAVVEALLAALAAPSP